MVAQRQSRDASNESLAAAASARLRLASVAFVALLAVAALAVIVPQPADADVIPNASGTWCNAAKKLRYNYGPTTYSFVVPPTMWVPAIDEVLTGVDPLGFTFRFFGQDYTSMQASDNGLMSLISMPGTQWQGSPMPNAGGANAIIGALWYDWDPTDGGSLRSGNMGGYYVFSWDGMQKSPIAPGTIAVSYPGHGFQIKLFDADDAVEVHVKTSSNIVGTAWGGYHRILGIESHYDSANAWQGGLYRQVTETLTGYAFRFVPVYDAAPTAVSDVYAATQGSVLSVSGGLMPGLVATGNLYYIRTSGVLANDTDEIQCATKTAQLVTGIPAGQGTLTLAADGGFTYDPGNFCGTTSFTYRVSDPAGSAGGSVFLSGTATVTLNVACLPNALPTAVCSILTAAPYAVGQNVQFSSSGSADSDGTIVAYEWTFTGGPALSTSANPSVSWASPGPYTASLRVRDDDLAWSAYVQCPITIGDPVGPNLPPTAAEKSYDVTTGITFQTTSNAQGSLASAASDPDGDALTFTACAPPLAGLNLLSNGHFTWPSPPTPQVVTFQYRVSDGLQQSPCATVTLNVVPNQKPVARFSATPNPVKVGEIVSFADLSTDPDTADLIVQWAWSFGDGQVSTQSQPSHAFGAVGTATVCLTVVDDKGATSSKFCQAIKVEAESAAAPPPQEAAPVEQPGPAEEDDSGPPLTVRIDGPASATAGETVTLTAHVDGGPASLTWFKLHGDATMTPSGNTVSFTIPAGADAIYVGVTASAAGRAAEAAHLVTVRAAGDAVAMANIEGPATAVTGASITLDGSGSTGATRFGWTQVSGPVATLVGADTPRATVSFTHPGEATFMLAVGDAVATHTVTVTQPAPDEVVSGFTLRTNGNTVELTPHVAAAKYVWTFGDGSPPQETDGATAHTYDAPGTYEITMTVGAKEYVASAKVATPEPSAPAGGAEAEGNGWPTLAILAGAAILLAAVAVLVGLRVHRRRGA